MGQPEITAKVNQLLSPIVCSLVLFLGGKRFVVGWIIIEPISWDDEIGCCNAIDFTLVVSVAGLDNDVLVFRDS